MTAEMPIAHRFQPAGRCLRPLGNRPLSGVRCTKTSHPVRPFHDDRETAETELIRLSPKIANSYPSRSIFSKSMDWFCRIRKTSTIGTRTPDFSSFGLSSDEQRLASLNTAEA